MILFFSAIGSVIFVSSVCVRLARWARVLFFMGTSPSTSLASTAPAFGHRWDPTSSPKGCAHPDYLSHLLPAGPVCESPVDPCGEADAARRFAEACDCTADQYLDADRRRSVADSAPLYQAREGNPSSARTPPNATGFSAAAPTNRRSRRPRVSQRRDCLVVERFWYPIHIIRLLLTLLSCKCET